MIRTLSLSGLGDYLERFELKVGDKCRGSELLEIIATCVVAGNHLERSGPLMKGLGGDCPE